MTSLNCPKCQGTLESILYQGIEVDRCCQCAGIWFDDQEIEALKGLEGSETIDLGDITTTYPEDSQNKAVLCPRCHIPMNRLLDMDKYPIWYEQCPRCYGIWLDKGEFNQFKQNFSPIGWLGRLKKRLT